MNKSNLLAYSLYCCMFIKIKKMKFLLFFKQMSAIKISLLLISPILTFILSMKNILIALFIIILIDMITGIRKSIHKEKKPLNIFKKEFWQIVNSSGFRSTWRKTYEYGVGILIFALLDLYVVKGAVINLFESKRSLSELSIAIACVIEVYSVFENMEAITGRNLLKRLIALLPKKITDIIDKTKK